jgi:tetratricopeptide (TPR) repeat protein
MMMPGKARPLAAAAAVTALLLFSACTSHLREAKAAYAEGQEMARGYRTAQAVAAYKRALSEAGLEVRGNPSAQAFMVKGLAEANLGLWHDAETSFVKAAGMGFEPGEAWASDVALLGLAVSFEELGIRDPALRAYENLLAKSAFKPVLTTAAQRYVDLMLARALVLEEREKDRALAGLVKAIEKLEADDFACGLYHYLHSQAEGHRGDYRRSYDEAVAARELGLPSEKILRDNDNQIVFCFDKLAGSLDGAGREALAASHAAWTKKWGWKDARTPGWKEISLKE